MRLRWPITRRIMPAAHPHRCGRCLRCGQKWSRTRLHDTSFGIGTGCFPLCESCWAALIPATRLPYYRALWERWYGNAVRSSDSEYPLGQFPTRQDRLDSLNADWPLIAAAVMEGK